jgi:hypothetical protein
MSWERRNVDSEDLACSQRTIYSYWVSMYDLAVLMNDHRRTTHAHCIGGVKVIIAAQGRNQLHDIMMRWVQFILP